MITILYFARFREKLGLASEDLALPEDSDSSVQTVLDTLAARGGLWQEFFAGDSTVMVAINQDMATRASQVLDEDEMAIFPPVTGG